MVTMWLKWFEACCTFRVHYHNVEEKYHINEVNLEEGLRSFRQWLALREKEHKSKSIKTDVKCRVIRRYYSNI